MNFPELNDMITMHENVSDTITLENEHTFNVIITMGLCLRNDYGMKIKFPTVTGDEMDTLIKFS